MGGLRRPRPDPGPETASAPSEGARPQPCGRHASVGGVAIACADAASTAMGAAVRLGRDPHRRAAPRAAHHLPQGHRRRCHGRHRADPDRRADAAQRLGHADLRRARRRCARRRVGRRLRPVGPASGRSASFSRPRATRRRSRPPAGLSATAPAPSARRCSRSTATPPASWPRWSSGRHSRRPRDDKPAVALLQVGDRRPARARARRGPHVFDPDGRRQIDACRPSSARRSATATARRWRRRDPAADDAGLQHQPGHQPQRTKAIARADDRGDSVLQIALPLNGDADLLNEIVDRVGDVLTDAGAHMRLGTTAGVA